MLGGPTSYHGRMRVLVVDGANVVGSRPDGWWRDRAGAARRLHEQLAAADLPYDEVLLVLEGAAKEGMPEGLEGRLHTVHAPASGDDAIVEAVTDRLATGGGSEVVVVTADRVLRDRVKAVGAGSLGPAWLLGRL
jgi:predicted RNA-binding protein with PIN domain